MPTSSTWTSVGMPGSGKTAGLLIAVIMATATGCAEDQATSNPEACASASGALQAIGNLMDTPMTPARLPLLQAAGDQVADVLPGATGSVATTMTALVEAVRDAEPGAAFSRWQRLLDVFAACEIA